MIASTIQSHAGIHGHFGRRAFTLVELLMAISIFSILGTAAWSMTVAAMEGDSTLRTINASESEIDLAVRRISNNLMACQTGQLTTGASTLSTLTQPDAASGYSGGATVSYALQNDPAKSGQKMLMENDQRYGNNAIVHHVTLFSVAPVSGVADVYQVDLVVGGAIVIECHFKVYARN